VVWDIPAGQRDWRLLGRVCARVRGVGRNEGGRLGSGFWVGFLCGLGVADPV
jgi:hypothetical protein